jgi:hypothetical protein
VSFVQSVDIEAAAAPHRRPKVDVYRAGLDFALPDAPVRLWRRIFFVRQNWRLLNYSYRITKNYKS